MTALRARLCEEPNHSHLGAIIMEWQVKQIISVCHQLTQGNSTSASTSELIAAAFVLNRMEYLPHGYSVIEAWERLDDWQSYVKRIRHEHMHLIQGI